MYKMMMKSGHKTWCSDCKRVIAKDEDCYQFFVKDRYRVTHVNCEDAEGRVSKPVPQDNEPKKRGAKPHPRPDPLDIFPKQKLA